MPSASAAYSTAEAHGVPSSLLVASAAILPWATSVRASSAGVRVVVGATGASGSAMASASAGAM